MYSPVTYLNHIMDAFMIKSTDMHTCGSPLRIIEKAEIKGKTLLDKLKYTRDNVDVIRNMMNLEPHGHFDS